jgi:hypothetical protein
MRELVVNNGIRTRSGVRDALLQLHQVYGATGEIRFDPDGTSPHQPGLMRVTASGFQPL